MSTRALRVLLSLLFLRNFSFSQNAHQLAALPCDPLELATGIGRTRCGVALFLPARATPQPSATT